MIDLESKILTKFLTSIGRTTYIAHLDVKYGETDYSAENDTEKANLISSQLPNGKHAPIFDLDVPCYFVSSSTLGHHHLYIEKEVTWEQYYAILEAMEKAGIIQSGWVNTAREEKRTFLRLPGIKKED